jgi:hypothetical protein
MPYVFISMSTCCINNYVQIKKKKIEKEGEGTTQKLDTSGDSLVKACRGRSTPYRGGSGGGSFRAKDVRWISTPIPHWGDGGSTP